MKSKGYTNYSSLKVDALRLAYRKIIAGEVPPGPLKPPAGVKKPSPVRSSPAKKSPVKTSPNYEALTIPKLRDAIKAAGGTFKSADRKATLIGILKALRK